MARTQHNTAKPLDKFQRLVADSYESGEFSYCKNLHDVLQTGDGLFQWLMFELSDSEDCENFDDARKRLDTALREIREVSDAFEDAAE